MSGGGAGPDAGGAQAALLAVVLDRLVPPLGSLPGAGGLGLAARVPGEAAAPVLAALPADFAALAEAAQVEALRAIEEASPAEFAELVRLTYTVYYTDERVLQDVARETGYAARPPQPLGYELEPFDPELLAVVSKNAPSYRKVEP